jgi:transposase
LPSVRGQSRKHALAPPCCDRLLRLHSCRIEALNTKIRVIHRRAHGLHDEEYFRLKILTSMLPEI